MVPGILPLSDVPAGIRPDQLRASVMIQIDNEIEMLDNSNDIQRRLRRACLCAGGTGVQRSFMPQNQGNHSLPDGELRQEDIQAAKNVVQAVLLTFTNFGLFPETHTTCRNSLDLMIRAIHDYFETRDSLKIHIRKDRLLFQNKAVLHQATADYEEQLPFILYRDGIRWIAFTRGITEEEIICFFRLLQRYRFPDEEPEGDLSTALWEADMDHILYESVIYWDAEPMNRFPELKPDPRQVREASQEIRETVKAAPSVRRPARVALWALDREEIEALREMVWQEENWSAMGEVLNVLLDLLDVQQEPEEFEHVLSHLRDLFSDALEQGEYDYGLEMLVELHRIRREEIVDRQWAAPLMAYLLQQMASPETLRGLRHSIRSGQYLRNPEALKTLRTLLLRLPPAAVTALGPMLNDSASPRIQRMLMEVIGIMAGKDIEPLEQVLQSEEDRELVYRLTHILSSVRGEPADRLLLRMLRHSSARIRKQAFKAILKRGTTPLEPVFFLIDDPDPAIRWLLLNHIRRKRDPTAESLMLRYLEDRQYLQADRDHLLTCYQTLGCCGSSEALPFLTDTLFGSFWSGLFGFGRAVEREGAILALMRLNREDARDLLRKAAGSLYPHIRLAYNRAREQTREKIE